MAQKFAIGMDVGGSHITAALIDINEMKVIEGSVSKVLYNSNLPAAEILDFWEKLIRSICEKYNVENLYGIALAIPGPFDYENGICWIKDQDKYEHFYGLNIKDLLRERLGYDQNFPVVFENDANSFGKGEVYKNIENLTKKVMAITLGTGLGACFIQKGKIDSTDENVPKDGEIWNLPYKNGIAEDAVSVRGLLSIYKDLSGIQLNNGLELFHLANEGNEKAITAFHKFGEELSEVVLPLIKSYNAEMFVIGGKLANAGDLFLNVFKEKAKSAGVNFELVISSDNETAALLGAASLLY